MSVEDGDDEPTGVTTARGSALFVGDSIDTTTLAVWSAETCQTVSLPLTLDELAELRDAASDILSD